MNDMQRAIAAALLASCWASACGKSDDTGALTSVPACAADVDCINLGHAYVCVNGRCSISAPPGGTAGAPVGAGGQLGAGGGTSKTGGAGHGDGGRPVTGGTHGAGGSPLACGASTCPPDELCRHYECVQNQCVPHDFTCHPAACPRSGGGLPCCVGTPCGTCGIDFGQGCVAAPASDGGRDETTHDAGRPPVSGYRTAITRDEVTCGSIPACQPPIIKCCSSTASTGGGCAQTSAACSSNISLECDGPEDCASGVCSGEPYGGGVQTQCSSTKGTYQICHDHTQCPEAAPNCCPIYSGDFKPYLGACDTRTTLSAGACDTPSGGGSLPDASVPVFDGGVGKTPITPGEVSCGSVPACQAPVPKCCASTSASDQGGCGTANAVCTSPIVLQCDGPEDCAQGVCSGEPQGGGLWTQCQASKGTYQICHDHTQCPRATPNCCPIFTGEFKPYLGECDARTTVSTGACDKP